MAIVVKRGQWALSRIVPTQIGPLGGGRGSTTAAAAEHLADRVDNHYPPLNDALDGFTLPWALVRLDGNVQPQGDNTRFLPPLNSTIGELNSSQRIALRNQLETVFTAYSYLELGVRVTKPNFSDRYGSDTQMREIVSDIYRFLGHSDYRERPAPMETHNTPFSDDFGTDPYSAPRWTNHGDTIAWDGTNFELDVAHVGGDIIERYSVNNSGSIEHESQITNISHSGGETRICGPGGRMNGAGVDAYGLDGDKSGSLLRLVWTVSSSSVAVLSTVAHTFTANEWFTLCLACEGSSGSNVALSGWVQDEGSSKPSVPGFITDVGNEDITFTHTAANRLDDGSVHLDNGICAENAVSEDFDTRIDFFELRAISDRSVSGRIMSSLAGSGGLVSKGGIAGIGGGLAG